MNEKKGTKRMKEDDSNGTIQLFVMFQVSSAQNVYGYTCMQHGIILFASCNTTFATCDTILTC